MSNLFALPKTIDFFGISIAYYAMFIMTGLFTAMFLSVREAKRIGVDKDVLFDGIIYGFFVALLCTRMYYVIFNFNEFGFDILKILGFKGGLAGLAIHGGIIGGFTFAFFYTKFKKMDRWKTFDIMVPGFLIAQAIGRWGNFFNQEAYGPKTTYEFLKHKLFLPSFIVDQMKIYGSYYHPTFLYESVSNLIGFIIVIILRRTKKLQVGDLIFFYLTWYGFVRFFIELLRQDPLTFQFFGMTIKQNVLISVIFFFSGIIGFFVKRKFVVQPNYVEELVDKTIL